MSTKLLFAIFPIAISLEKPIKSNNGDHLIFSQITPTYIKSFYRNPPKKLLPKLKN